MSSAIASTCCSELRASDLFGRLGGEEFLVVCRHSPLDMTLALAQGEPPAGRARWTLHLLADELVRRDLGLVRPDEVIIPLD